MSATETKGPETKGPEIKGWCPGALRPMLSGDGWVVRVRPYVGRLMPEQAVGIADLALRHGNGWLDLSSRANLQLRGITEAGHTPLIAGLQALALVDPDAEAETRRNVIVTPFWAADDGTYDLARDLSQALRAAENLPLPAKFGFAVDTGPVPVLRDASADIRLERAGHGLILRADGARTGQAVSRDQAVPQALALARWFLETGGAGNGRGRMAAHLARLAPNALAMRGNKDDGTVTNIVPMIGCESVTPGPGPTPAGFLAAFAFGQFRAETLAALAEIGPLRLTPWRMVLVEGRGPSFALPELITQADDPLLRVIACTGAPGCPQALQPTRDIARQLAPHVPADQTLHVAGCAKGCAHPGPAPFTLVGQANGFGLIHRGTSADAPTLPLLSSARLRADASLLFGPN